MQHPVAPRDAGGRGSIVTEDHALAQKPRLLQHHLRRRRLRAGRRCRGFHGSVLQPGHGLDFLHQPAAPRTSSPSSATGSRWRSRSRRHNRDFTVSHRRWFDALYKDKYEYIGEFDLMSLAFRLDLSLYYWGVVEVPFQHRRGSSDSHRRSRRRADGFSPH